MSIRRFILLFFKNGCSFGGDGIKGFLSLAINMKGTESPKKKTAGCDHGASLVQDKAVYGAGGYLDAKHRYRPRN